MWTSVSMNAGVNGYVSRNDSSSAPVVPSSDPSSTSHTCGPTRLTLAKAASSFAAASSSFGLRRRAWAICGRLRSSSVIVSKRPEASRRLSWMAASAAPEISSPTSSRRSRWRAMNETIGTARRESAPSTKFVILSASRDELLVVDPVGEPQDQLVHEEDEPVVAERLRMLGDHRETGVQRDETVLVLGRVAGEPGNQVALASCTSLARSSAGVLGLTRSRLTSPPSSSSAASALESNSDVQANGSPQSSSSSAAAPDPVSASAPASPR